MALRVLCFAGLPLSVDNDTSLTLTGHVPGTCRYALMEGVLDKLKLLHYERRFLCEGGGSRPPLLPVHFALDLGEATGGGGGRRGGGGGSRHRQFGTFCSLCSWLFARPAITGCTSTVMNVVKHEHEVKLPHAYNYET